MAPSAPIRKAYHSVVKGNHHPYYTTEAPVPPDESATVKEMLTTIIDHMTTTMKSLIPIDSNTNETIPIDENSNSSSVDVSNNMNMTRIDGNSSFFTTFSTSFEQVTTMSGIDEDMGMHMEHHEESSDYYSVLYIILGVILGILILVTIVLGVVYKHYKKKGFQEISGDNGKVNPQSMKQLQQASSQDALLDK